MSTTTAAISQPIDHGMIVEKDVKIPLRDGGYLYADIFRPDSATEKFPAIANITVYNKDKLWIPPSDLEEEANPYMNWEAANPMWWVPRGYVCVRIDSRGTGKSPGRCEPSSYQESVDFYDCIEWLAKQEWCSGNLGTLGISYHAACQWRLANLNPPSLKAIIPWEGRADQYRDQAYHGGIFSMGFLGNWINQHMARHLLGRTRKYNPDSFSPDMLWQYLSHDLDSEWWRMCSARWDQIKVPVYTVGNWGGWGLHLRGNTEAYLCAASKHKKLRIHTGDHFRPFHSNEGKVDQLRFFDYWLKGMQNGIMDEPPIKLEIRTGGSKKPYAFRFENEWPLARTQWTKMYFSIENERSPDEEHAEGRLVTEQVTTARQISYSGSNPNKAGIGSGSSAPGIGRSGISFVTDPMAYDTEITGPLMANLWVSSTAEDMDVMVTLRNIDPDGKEVFELGQQGQPVVLTKGWLRASHRKLDPQKSLPYRPYHAHNERLWLEPDVPVECQIEIISTCIVLKKGHQLRVDIHAQDSAGSGNFTHFHADYNEEAIHTFYAGGAMNSYILLPIIPS
ncbi:CocE/NonD family hydrolase [Polynucleobacter sp. UK-Mo-2m-Kol15]|uniref:CocE/NonD family hydrolase n=1 Tax=Polynucleobacter sp. UK-Mo-2m-Kol15 TaxID=2576916 RepID=UPI001C0C8E99|nr:CocE/NonD family hydrolase [Polynucleobacter sp. UK-Mo-2m-Kol15]MBU3574881.1 CocE/NonD family hydrolase [Polynucleobacter sp. UK-Mo-2m-Kol15]